MPEDSEGIRLHQCGGRSIMSQARHKDLPLSLRGSQVWSDSNRNGYPPPHPEEGAGTCALERRKHRAAPVSKDVAAHRSRRRARGCEVQIGQRARLLTIRPTEASCIKVKTCSAPQLLAGEPRTLDQGFELGPHDSRVYPAMERTL